MSMPLPLHQASLPGFCPVVEAVEALAADGGVESRGAVFTRREVVEFILDLVGYTADRPLPMRRLLEPSFGAGDFLLPAIDRLLAAWKASGDAARPIHALGDCIRAVELHAETFAQTRSTVIAHLVAADLGPGDAAVLADRWLVQGDFLLVPLHGAFDTVVGNPPYVRQERIPDALLAEYRRRYSTLYDRADLYVPFLERCLKSLARGGALGVICADRWMKNRYGGPLRALVAEGFRLKVHVDMTDTPAFHADVAAYPAITVITRENGGPTRVARRPAIERRELGALADALTAGHAPPPDGSVRELPNVARGAEPWLLEAADRTALIRRLERLFPTLEEAGCRVGIGVATGADDAFIAPFDTLDVEPDRKLRLVTTRDIAGGTVAWQGLGVVNPFSKHGDLVDLACYPRLGRYLEARKARIASRHCVKKSPARWYRTIDRITPSLAVTPKLLIPDIKGEAHVVHEEGHFYPHHNLYVITADTWDLRALQAVLRSGIARLFVATYSTRMRGGFLRFQAQYLRRIRVPHWNEVPVQLRHELGEAAASGDAGRCNRAVAELYGLSGEEWTVLEGRDEAADAA